MKDRQLLQSLKLQLAQYKTFDCKLRHEEIIAVEFNTDAGYLETVFEPNFERFGFCSKAHRNINISCAHTIAAINFKRIISEISIITGYERGNLLMQAMDKLLCEIYLTDIEKGSLEKKLVFSKYRNLPIIEIEKIEETLVHIIEKHSEQVHELELLRQTIINDTVGL